MASLLFTDRVKALKLPLDELIVIGSGVMDALNLRQSNDIDLVVTDRLFNELETSGWKKERRHGEDMLLQDDTEVWLTWGIEDSSEHFDQLRRQSVTINGVVFSSPLYVMKWKMAMKRPKDIEDVQLLKRYIHYNG